MLKPIPSQPAVLVAALSVATCIRTTGIWYGTCPSVTIARRGCASIVASLSVRYAANPFSEDFDFMGARRSYSDRYAESVVRQVIYSDTANVARQQGLSEDIVWSMVEYVSAKKSASR
jgi:hypothetical protein